MRTTIQYHPGSKTIYDPEHMLMQTTVDEIEQMLEYTIAEAARTDGVFNDMEREFVRAANHEYVRKTRNGYAEYPLSGRQVVWLGHLYRKIAANTVRTLEKV